MSSLMDSERSSRAFNNNFDVRLKNRLAVFCRAIKSSVTHNSLRVIANIYDICTISPKFTTCFYSDSHCRRPRAGPAPRRRSRRKREQLRLNKMLNAETRGPLLRIHARNPLKPRICIGNHSPTDDLILRDGASKVVRNKMDKPTD